MKNNKKILKSIFVLMVLGANFNVLADYYISSPKNLKPDRLLNEVGRYINADEYVAQVKNKDKKTIEKKINYMLQQDSIKENQKGALIDVADQLKLTVNLSKNNIQTYEKYLSLKQNTLENEIVYFDKTKENTEYKKIKYDGSGAYQNVKVVKVISDNLLKEHALKRYQYNKMGANIPPLGYLSFEEEKQLKEKFKLQLEENEKKQKELLIQEEKRIYEDNKNFLNSSIQKLIKDKTIDEYCVNMDMNRSFANADLEIYKNFFYDINMGNFKLTQKSKTKSPYLLLTPTLKEIKRNLKKNERLYRDQAVENNVFVIEVKNPSLFKKMINVNIKSNPSSNLMITNINDLALFAVKLNGKDKQDFFNIAGKMIEYNALACVY